MGYDEESKRCRVTSTRVSAIPAAGPLFIPELLPSHVRISTLKRQRSPIPARLPAENPYLGRRRSYTAPSARGRPDKNARDPVSTRRHDSLFAGIAFPSGLLSGGLGLYTAILHARCTR